MGSIGLFASMLWGKIPAGIKFGFLGLVAGAALLAGVYAYGIHEGHQDGQQAATQADANAYKDRAHEDATINALDRLRLCVALGGRLPDCQAKLRRLGQDQSPADDSSLSGRP